MDTPSKPQRSLATARQFSLRSLAIWIALVCIVVSVGALKIRQDRNKRDAIAALQYIGFQPTIGSANGRGVLWLRYAKPSFADGGLELSIRAMKTLQRRHDWGMSDGLEIKLVDFTNCRVSEHVITELQARFPDAEIRR